MTRIKRKAMSTDSGMEIDTTIAWRTPRKRVTISITMTPPAMALRPRLPSSAPTLAPRSLTTVSSKPAGSEASISARRWRTAAATATVLVRSFLPTARSTAGLRSVRTR